MEKNSQTIDFRQVLLSSGLFDRNYYNDKYVGADLTLEDSINHFWQYGRFDTRNPSEKFSTFSYLDSYPDILTDGWPYPPVMHYLLHGRSEGRLLNPVRDNYPHIQPRLRLSELKPPADEGIRAKIAVTIHVYYREYVGVLVAQLAMLQFEFDLFITSPFQDVVDSFIEVWGRSEVARGSVHARVTPNRGRNFGPLFVEYGEALRQYDIVGHVHSKKSLYTGHPRYDWGYHCISGVLGSPEYMEAVLWQLSKGTRYGIVCTEKHPALPFWAYHWLKNTHQGLTLAEELGLDFEEGFASYPVGGMFWARREVMEPLLQRKWKYEDFPEEAGQTDGTVHHALERLLGAAARHAGFSTLRWMPDAGEFNTIEEPGIAHLMTVSRTSVMNCILDADVISFDIFDTLLYRDVRDPEDVRDRIGPSYRKLRWEAEVRARTALSDDRDVRQLDIANQLAKLTGESVERALRWLDLEFRTDMSTMHARTSVIELVRYATASQKRIIYVSDMYYSTAELEAIFRHLNIPKADAVYVSSEMGKRKDRGDMWVHLRDRERGRILHFGDNMVSDIQNASDCGVSCVYIPTVMQKTKFLGVLRRKPMNAEWKAVLPVICHYGDDPFFC
ncbi:hypothetical protein M5E06_33030 [Azospirillum sp. A1-3]|uniref:rhamnan synthesis F family protein n=1 Tax=Azospirillum sp. A1-3 TaxID=185874 RepID=UPI002077202F|nr:rhamnan synthesis F family protein [Azospirillum sp. A1-3]MCM8738910.1 hypothetical protein [Azospirillum sp. A1-3]